MTSRPGRQISTTLGALGALIAGGVVGCGGHAAPPARPPASPAVLTRPLCTLDTTVGLDRPPVERTYPTGYWLALLVGGYQGSGEYTRPPRDCRDAVARLDRDGCINESQPDVLPGRLLSPQDLVVSKLDEKRRLVWAMTDRLSDGEVQGPVGLAELTPRGIDIRALGVLRAYPENVSLRLERVGQQSVLVADGEYCETGQVGEECARAVRLVPLVEDRFVARSLVDADGSCLGRAFIPVRGSGIVPDGQRMKYRVETLVTFAADTIVLREQLAIDLSPSRADSAKSSYVTRVQADRQVYVRGGGLVTTGPSLLSRYLARQDRQDREALPPAGGRH